MQIVCTIFSIIYLCHPASMTFYACKVGGNAYFTNMHIERSVFMLHSLISRAIGT